MGRRYLKQFGKPPKKQKKQAQAPFKRRRLGQSLDRADPTHMIVGRFKDIKPKLLEGISFPQCYEHDWIVWYKGPGYTDLDKAGTRSAAEGCVRMFQLRYPNCAVQWINGGEGHVARVAVQTKLAGRKRHRQSDEDIYIRAPSYSSEQRKRAGRGKDRSRSVRADA